MGDILQGASLMYPPEVQGGGNGFDLIIGGNTAGATASVSSGTLTLAGGNNITLSQNGNAISIIGGGGGANFSAGISGGNTSGNTGTVSNQFVLAGGNNIILSGSTNAGGMTVTISGSNQSVQTQNLFDLTLAGNTSGTLALVSSGTLTLAGGNNIILSQVGNAITISASNQSVQTQNLFDLTLAGNTAGTLALVSSGTLTLAGGNNIVLSQNGNAITISASNQSVQTQNCVDVSLSGNTSGTLALVSSGTLILAGGNNIVLSQNGQSVTISDAFTQSVQTQNLFDLTLAGNTAGTLTLVSSGTLTLAGGNNITLSQSGNAVTISAANQSVQTQNLFDLTLAGNTTGTLTLVSSGTLTLAGGNNIVLSQNGNAITISASNQSVQTQNCVDISLAGNTQGALALISSGTAIFAGGNNISLSQNGQSVTIRDGMNTVSEFIALPPGVIITNVGLGTNNNYAVYPYQVQGFLSASQVNQFVSISMSTSGTANSTLNGTYGFTVGIYTRTGSTLSLASSGSQSYSFTNTSNINTASISGQKAVSLPMNAYFTPGDYFIAFAASTSSSGNLGWTASQNAARPIPGAAPGGYLAATTNTSFGFLPGWGYFSVTTAALPGSIGLNQLQNNGLAVNIPILAFMNYTS